MKRLSTNEEMEAKGRGKIPLDDDDEFEERWVNIPETGPSQNFLFLSFCACSCGLAARARKRKKGKKRREKEISGPRVGVRSRSEYVARGELATSPFASRLGRRPKEWGVVPGISGLPVCSEGEKEVEEVVGGVCACLNVRVPNASCSTNYIHTTKESRGAEGEPKKSSVRRRRSREEAESTDASGAISHVHILKAPAYNFLPSLSKLSFAFQMKNRFVCARTKMYAREGVVLICM